MIITALTYNDFKELSQHIGTVKIYDTVDQFTTWNVYAISPTSVLTFLASSEPETFADDFPSATTLDNGLQLL